MTKNISGGTPMNDNFEKKTPEKGKDSEQFVKKFAKFSAFIYLGLAITVVIVATVGIFSISYDYEESMPEISLPAIDLEFSKSEEVVIPEISDSPVINEQSGVDAETETDKPEIETDKPEPTPEPEPVFCRPVKGEIVKGHSLETLVFSETMQDYRVHRGVDISCKLGAEVVAFTDGVVSAVNDDYFYGTTVAITHDDGMVSYYMNLNPELAEFVTVGAEVKAGEMIGKVGTSARCELADNPHLHFELKVNGADVDPKTELP